MGGQAPSDADLQQLSALVLALTVSRRHHPTCLAELDLGCLEHGTVNQMKDDGLRQLLAGPCSAVPSEPPPVGCKAQPSSPALCGKGSDMLLRLLRSAALKLLH